MTDNPLAMGRKNAFADRYGTVFGRQQGLMLKMAGLASSECSASGTWIEDSAGNRWLDFGSFGVHLLGHAHPQVVHALTAQAARMGLSSKILANEPIVSAAERLLALGGAPLDNLIFANTGSEAVEAALKLARIATGRRRILAFRHAYHGRTPGALSVSHGYERHGALLTDGQSSFVEVGDLAAVEAALASGTYAAAIIEPVQGEGGIRPVDPAFLQALRALTRAHGTRLVLDEIQTGLGRTGELVCPVSPDVRLLGKVLGGGMFPVAAALFDTAQFGAAARDPVVHASSFAGSPLAGAVVNAVIDVVNEASFAPRIARLGARCREALAARIGAHPGVAAIRGQGFMIGVEFKDTGDAGQMIIEAAKRKLLVAFCLTAPNVVRVYPPAVIDEATLVDGIERFCDSVAALPVRHSPPQKEPLANA
ncbi:aspartate aminotransferase family protein [Variovorax atrisoli]|uniref:aspartate aminotransferase family protein n=1 Tax=Variovorax atrisoli TaxID=3394203 RepID=UPI0040403EB7